MQRDIMRRAGVIDIKEWEPDGLDTASHPISIRLEGIKGDAPPQTDTVTIPKVGAVISMPRLAFTDNMFSALPAMHARGIDVCNAVGAYWGQCLERVMMSTIDRGCEWIVTLDYDTVFDGPTLDSLFVLMAQHPEADAIAPLQMKRDGDTPMIWDLQEDGEPKREWSTAEFEKELTKIRHAHFGLTLFRVSSLQKMKHPWFIGKPNADGEWGEGRTDDDIQFWEQWAEIGNTLYLANHVPIGHMQLVTTWPTQDFGVVHQYMREWREDGKPQSARR